GDTNGVADTFVRDNRTGHVTRIAEHTADAPMISRNGRYVGLKFADGSTYGVHDRSTGTTTTWTGPTNLSVPVLTDDGTRALYGRSEEHTSELQSREKLVCRLLLEKQKDEDMQP